MSQLALGNRKSCDLDVLELDQSNGRLEAEFTLRHRHAWPSLREAQTQLRAALGPIGTDVEDLADLLPDTTFDAARKLYHKLDLQAHEASTRAYQAEQRAHEAADRVATKGQELAALARELAQAQTDLRAATEREALASQEAQAACVQMLGSMLRSASRETGARNASLSPAKPLVYGGRDGARNGSRMRPMTILCA